MQLPPPQVTRAVIQRFARLRARYGADFGVRPLVLPDASFFPDAFTPDTASLARITRRMQAHAGLRDVPIAAEIVGSDSAPESARGGSCSSGGCAVPASVSSGAPRLIDDGDSWRIQIPELELNHPVALTTNLARSLAFIFLVETQREGERLEPPLDVTADLVATNLGFGPLLLQGSYLYAKSCGGPQIRSFTTVSTSELSLCVALFAAIGRHPLAPAIACLDVTQRAALSAARDLVASNRALVEQLRDAPDATALGLFDLEPPGSFLTNWFRERRLKNQAAHKPDPSLLESAADADDLESLRITMPPSSRAGRKLAAPAE
ncbi:MAG TPA: hypothetical protein VLC09_09100 [Polyangiaceae bacterium]|nr:hypothetical protein [Polyangiaceae bacterium]